MPGALLTGDGDRLDLVVHAAPLFAEALAPFYLAPGGALQDAYRGRLFLTWGIALFGLLLTGLGTLAMTVLAVMRRRDRVYHWAALSGASAGVICLHYAALRPPLPEALWHGVWTVSVTFLVAALHRFTNRFLRRGTNRAETIGIGFAFVSVAFMAAVVVFAPQRLLAASAIVHVSMLGVAVYLLATFLRDRRFTTAWRFRTLYAAMCLCAALAAHDALFFYLRPAPVTTQLGQFMPLVFIFVIGWLVLVQLVTALARQEALTAKLRERVIERSRALRQTTDRLHQSERDMLLAEERQRIMMDLHDGVGGHLVNALAGLRGASISDSHLRDLLEEAQTDLGLMVDSLHNPGDVAGLLAALRARLEPFLERQGLRFDWQVDQEPQLPDPGPSANIDLLRIVQEFVTNTLKHDGAGCITVQTGARHLRLSDDGRGFDAPRAGGHGLSSMTRRARRIGARIRITATANGTTLRLDW